MHVLMLGWEFPPFITGGLGTACHGLTKALDVRGSIKLNSSEYPDTLPIGSGNEDNTFVADGDSPGNLRSSKFYPRNTNPKCS